MIRSPAAFAAVVLALSPGAALAQSDLVEFYFNAGVNAHFYYSPSSVTRNGSTRLVAWTDSNLQQANHGTEAVVFHARLDCAAGTIQSLWAERFSKANGGSLGVVQLNGTADPYRPGTMGGNLAARVC